MIWAVLPLKDLVRAKSRLSGVLAAHERRALVQAMVEDVFSALAATGGLAGVLVVSDDPSAEMLADKYGFDCIDERQLNCRGLNGAVSAAVNLLAARDVEDALVLHGDIPLLQSADLERMLEEYNAAGTDLVIAPDLDGTGTNLMLLPSNCGLQFRYGVGSCQAHAAAAAELGLTVKYVHSEGMGLDVDEPGDLLQVYARLNEIGRGSHCAHLLLDADIDTRLKAMAAGGLGTDSVDKTHDAI